LIVNSRTGNGVALVSGASRGLGAAIARRLGADGWAVAVNYWGEAEAAGQVVNDIRAAGGVAEAFGADVTDEGEVADLAARVTERLGGIEVLVVNATGPQPPVPFEKLTWQDHLDQLVFFVKSPTLLAQAVVPGMKERGGGRIIQIGSDVFERSLPGMSAYIGAKGAQIGLARSWARELGPHGINVNVVAPGWIPVERHADILAEELGSYTAEVPLGKIGKPEDIAAAVSFLASDGGAYINGERIIINGGHTIG
jgi:3-oxoacyl-[acyl-carrier protein] reductase